MKRKKSKIFFVSGTDTGIGKTLISSILVSKISGSYWKPIQCGSLDFSDTDCVKNITKISKKFFLKPTYEFSAPLSPHEAARLENKIVKMGEFNLPKKKN